MQLTKVPYQNTNLFSALMEDYLQKEEKLRAFYKYAPEMESFDQAIAQREAHSVDRDKLVAALTVQYQGVEKVSTVENNIQRLKEKNCFTVTTGHQLNLFTGPLYFIYKIASTIHLAKQLKERYPDRHFVPVYWMATEDHDFAEVNHFNLFGNRYALEQKHGGAVGKLNLEGVEELLAQLSENLGDRKGTEEIVALFSRFYQSDKTFTEATRSLVNHLFGAEGLVIIDGDDATLKALFHDEVKKELTEQSNHRFIEETTDELKKLGYKAQVNPRTINLFYLKEQLRERIVLEEGIYKVLNTNITFGPSEILDELNAFPERFSPNAVMRPLYQEKILPNLAYVGGGGELSYWLQLNDMFADNHVFFPILLHRNSVLLLDNGSQKRLDKLGLTISEIFESADELIKKYLDLRTGNDIKVDDQKLVLSDVFDLLQQKASKVDKTLEPMVKAEQKKALKAIDQIATRLVRAEKNKEKIAVDQIKNLKQKLFPNNSLQERHHNLISLLLFHERAIQELCAVLDPLDHHFLVLSQ